MKAKKIAILLAASLCFAHFSGCAQIDRLKGGQEEEEVDKHELYEGWKVESGMSLDGLLVAQKVDIGGTEVASEYGKIQAKGLESFYAEGKSSAYACILQGTHYLKTEDGWIKGTKLTKDEEKYVAAVKSAFTCGFGDYISILSSKYVKTSDGMDVIEMESPDEAAKKAEELAEIAEKKVVDDGEFGNGLAVAIDDGGQPDNSEMPIIKVRVFVDEETGEIKKLQKKSGEAAYEAVTSAMKYELPEGMEEAREVEKAEWLSAFAETMKKIGGNAE